jgi:anhydro-N-acetylmuramic acid kinase
MKKHIQQLSAIARKKKRTIAGLMSGTSLDGLDVAVCDISGAGRRMRLHLRGFETIPYDEKFQTEIRKVFAQKIIDLQHLTLLNVYVAEQQADMLLQALHRMHLPPSDIDLVASHGQTVFHAPRIFHGLHDWPNATLQIGDGDHFARRCGIITISDFRQKHLAAGGEGAPLALYGDYFLFSRPGEDRFLLNLGGIANFTFLPADGDSDKAFATDTGPGNTLLDAFARALFQVPFDRDGLLAANGRVEESVLNHLLHDPFFALPFPKTSGPEYFSEAWVQAALHHLPKGRINPYDLMATLARLTADTVAGAIQQVGLTGRRQALYISGGGAHNPAIVERLKQHFPKWHLAPMSALGIDGDAKEAVLFAALANETVAGTTPPDAVLGGVPLVSMGKVSFPG